jgi:ATP synthase protein I
MSRNDDQKETNVKAGIAYAAALSLFGAVVGGLIAGWLLDRWLGTRPWLLVVGLILGAAGGFYEFIRATSKLT